jgi:hypothetical protein
MSSKYAIIEDKIVKNIVICSEEEALQNGWVSAEGAFIGDEYVNETFIRQENILFPDWKTVRLVRNQLLTSSDWIVVSSMENKNPIPDEWKEYRQELRDITKTFSSPNEVVLPQIPLQ